MSSKLRTFFIVYILKLLVLMASPGNANLLKQKKAILINLLNPDRYDAEMKPGILDEVSKFPKSLAGLNYTSSDAPTTVYVSLHVLSITDIDDNKMMYSLEMYVRQKWKDERLEFTNKSNNIEYIVLNENRRIWMPDLFFPNEHSSRTHELMETNSFRKIFKDGTVLTSARVTLVVRCRMSFSLYPMDTQTCSLRIESYRWKADDINLEWMNGSAVTLGDDILVPLFNVDRFWTDRGLIPMESGEYSALTVYFKFARRFGHYLVQIYIPCAMAFLTSCLPFWLNPKLITARVVIGTAVLLSTAFHITLLNWRMPKVAYTKAIDVFTGMSLTFIFCALVETICVHVTESRSTRRLQTQDSVSKDDIEQIEKTSEKPNAIVKMKVWMFEDHATLNDIDAACRALFPTCFLLFIFIYSLTCVSLQTD